MASGKGRRGRLKPVPQVKALTGEEYWKLRYLASWETEERYKKMIAEKEIECLQLRLAMAQNQANAYENQATEIKEDYNKLLKELELKYDFKLEKCSIDSKDYTIHGGGE